ncbi:MAG: AEC family transporter [Clostridia bacterium]|nr:AEC family transporter [Clostridia bacterium]
MFQSFRIAFEAVIPFLVYLGIGFIIVRVGLADVPFMNGLNKITFRVIFPFLMFNNIYKASADELPSARLMLSAAVSILLLVAALMAAVPRLIRENPRRGVVIQGIFRSNYMLYGVPLTLSVFGAGYAGSAGIMVMIVVAIYNALSVVVLEIFSGEGRVHWKTLPLKLAKNPLLQGCALGLVFFLAGIRLPAFLESPVTALSGMATPLALITLGATLQFDAMRKNARLLLGVLTVKLVLLPLIMLPIGYFALGFRGVELFLYLMIFATPVAASSYPMAMNMGGDGELAGQLVFASTVLSLGTVFCFIFALSQLGLLRP